MSRQSINYDQAFLERFEAGIDPIHPQQSRVPARVLGYGEMSTVMTITGADPGLVFKRMPMFHSSAEYEPYQALYDAYLEHLSAAGVLIVPAAITSVVAANGHVVVYIIQEKLNSGTLVNKAIHVLPAQAVERLFAAILVGIGQVCQYNDAQDGAAALGFDAQMSNWAISDYDPDSKTLPEELTLVYVDTSSPLLRLDGVEQLDPELFLRSAPSFLRWIIRLLFLKDVMNRYYERRQVVVDVLANLLQREAHRRPPPPHHRRQSFFGREQRRGSIHTDYGEGSLRLLQGRCPHLDGLCRLPARRSLASPPARQILPIRVARPGRSLTG